LHAFQPLYGYNSAGSSTVWRRWKVVPRAPRDLPPGPVFYWCFWRAHSVFPSILGPGMNFMSSQGRFSRFFTKNTRPVHSQGPLPRLVQSRAARPRVQTSRPQLQRRCGYSPRSHVIPSIVFFMFQVPGPRSEGTPNKFPKTDDDDIRRW
jgi:hypothetical protein